MKVYDRTVWQLVGYCKQCKEVHFRYQVCPSCGSKLLYVPARWCNTEPMTLWTQIKELWGYEREGYWEVKR